MNDFFLNTSKLPSACEWKKIVQILEKYHSNVPCVRVMISFLNLDNISDVLMISLIDVQTIINSTIVIVPPNVDDRIILWRRCLSSFR